MADFSESIRKGMAAAEAAERNREEIASVFAALNKQLAEVTRGKVVIDIGGRSLPKNHLLAALIKLEGYHAIVAYNPDAPSSVEELAGWTQDRAGYPCKIKLGFKEVYCEDKEALEAELARLLEDPIVGEKLYQLMQLKAENRPEAIDISSEGLDGKQADGTQE